MFTGLVECTGTIVDIIRSNKWILTVESPISGELTIGQSVSHDGTCLTIIEVGKGWHRVELIQPTIQKTIARYYKVGAKVNLERSLQIGDRLEGHIVQGHVDTVLECVDVQQEENTRWVFFHLPDEFSHLIIPEGSVAINGVSLTVASIRMNAFGVGLIPHTIKVTNLGNITKGHYVNCEFDVIGRYIARLTEVYFNKTGR